MKTDWNGDGKHDWTDDYMDYKMSSGSSSSSGSGNRPVSSSGSFKISTWLLVIAVLGIVSGDLPINGFPSMSVCGVKKYWDYGGRT